MPQSTEPAIKREKNMQCIRLTLVVTIVSCLIAGCSAGEVKVSEDQTPVADEKQQSSSGQVAISMADYQPAVQTSPYADVLVRCVDRDYVDRHLPCRLKTMPLIGHYALTPTVEEVMAQTVVSHPWMAQRFREVLEQFPAELMRLFRGVTAVVIGADIRPSYYSMSTGAVYLEPMELWRTQQELDDLPGEPDLRVDYHASVGLYDIGVYMDGQQYAWDYELPPFGQIQRQQQDIVRSMAALLFHELAHANEFVPPTVQGAVNPNSYIYEVIEYARTTGLSDYSQYRTPLTASQLTALASVVFGDAQAQDLPDLSVKQIATAFASDGANDLYSYKDVHEDTAMLFEEVMMHYHFGLDRAVAFMTNDSGASDCRDFVVQWGQFNRIADDSVALRAQWTVEKVLNISDAGHYFTGLPYQPESMQVGEDICYNLFGE